MKTFKIILSISIALFIFLTACVPDVPETEIPSTEVPVETHAPNTQEPIETEEPIPTELPPTEPLPTEEPEKVCAKLLSPADGIEVPAVGIVTFEWEPVDGAENYILKFTLPGGAIVEFETDETTKDRYMEAFGVSGEFEWNVIAFDLNGSEICISEIALFTKPTVGNNSGGGDGGSDDGFGIPDGGYGN